MENKEPFKMTYSAEQQNEIKSIRDKYIPKEKSKLEHLRAIDAAVNRKATMISIIIGVIGTLIMGIGMSLLMTDIGGIFGTAAFGIGVIVGIIGIAVLATAYPIYNHILKIERKKAAPEIIRLTDELMK